MRYGLFRDSNDPSRYMEAFLVESWVEHLRQHERVTIDDQLAEAQVRAFHMGQEPPRSHT